MAKLRRAAILIDKRIETRKFSRVRLADQPLALPNSARRSPPAHCHPDLNAVKGKDPRVFFGKIAGCRGRL